MRYFFDCEFIEDGTTIDLISIGIVSESAGDQVEARTLYLQNANCKFEKASDWVWRNVLIHLSHFDMNGKRSCEPKHETYDSGLGHRYITKCLTHMDNPCHWATRSEIRDAILQFMDQEKYGKPEVWGYYADYDWVAFCQLFGPMIALPKGFPMYCRDLKQLLDEKGNPRYQKDDVHHALADAEWIAETYKAVTKV